jgi:hypothetical protein
MVFLFSPLVLVCCETQFIVLQSCVDSELNLLQRIFFFFFSFFFTIFFSSFSFSAVSGAPAAGAPAAAGAAAGAAGDGDGGNDGKWEYSIPKTIVYKIANLKVKNATVLKGKDLVTTSMIHTFKPSIPLPAAMDWIKAHHAEDCALIFDSDSSISFENEKFSSFDAFE